MSSKIISDNKLMDKTITKDLIIDIINKSEKENLRRFEENFNNFIEYKKIGLEKSKLLKDFLCREKINLPKTRIGELAKKINDVVSIKITAKEAMLLNYPKPGVNLLKLMKIIYLADRQSYINTGKTITGVTTFFAMKNGPTIHELINISASDAESSKPKNWEDIMIKRSPSDSATDIRYSLKSDEVVASLSDNHQKTLDEVWGKFGEYTGNQLAEMTHLFSEWDLYVDNELELYNKEQNEQGVPFNIEQIEQYDYDKLKKDFSIIE